MLACGPHGIRAAALSVTSLRRHRGLALAILLMALALVLRQSQERVDYTHTVLPNFDSFVFAAMADNPRVFTVAPWGYRLLHPSIVGALPPRFMVRAFRGLSFGSLALCGGLLFLFLRRLGHGEAAALLGVAAFAASGPVAEAVRVPFLGEPLLVALKLAFVVALEAGASLPVLALPLALGAFAKESVLFFPPLVFLARRGRDGNARAASAALLCALPAALVILAVRYVWTPYMAVPRAPMDVEMARAAWRELAQTWRPTGEALLLGGILPLALLGALRRQARPYLLRYGYVAAAMIAASLTAWVNVPSARAVPLFAANTLRILIYALPFLIPLVLMALDRVWPHMSEPAPVSPPRRRWPGRAAAAATAALVLAPVVALDPYRRAPLHESRDGPLVRATCQETLRVARRLARGETVTFDPAVQKFAWGVYDAAEQNRMRWFLRKGWGAMAHYGTGDIVMHEAQAGLLVPVLSPRDIEVRLTLESPQERRLQAFVNGAPAGSLPAGPQAAESALRIPAGRLFRGDNLLLLAAGVDASGVRLRRLTLRPAD
jgi:hypothetical protein